MSKSLLITRPNYDPVTTYLHAWSEDVIMLATKRRINVYDLRDQKASRSKFDSYVQKHNPSFIFLNGHGSSDIIAGQYDEPLIDLSSRLSNSLVYARSCDAGVNLGPFLIQQGMKAFIGYTRKFIFGYEPAWMKNPRKDKIAALFLSPSNLVASTLIKGHSVLEAHMRSREAMFKKLSKNDFECCNF